MNENLKCFISASSDTDTAFIKNILSDYDVDAIDIYDFSIGDSIQQILKRKIRQADFALFIISERSSANVIYEMGVCEGIGKQHFVFLEKDFKVPFYLENQLFIRADLHDQKFLKSSVEKILQSVSKKGKPLKQSPKERNKIKSYSRDIRDNLSSYLSQIKTLRKDGHPRELEYVLEEIFKTIKLSYVQNETNKDTGVDFALWNDELGKILGNPMIVEVKYGNISKNTFQNAEEQLNGYIRKTDAKVALLLYLDREGKRYKIKSALYPLIISYDVEDFVTELLTHSFESLILAQRNKIAHGID